MQNMPLPRLRVREFLCTSVGSTKHRKEVACAALAVFGALLQGCAPEPAGQDPAGPFIVRAASSSTSSELSVASWKILRGNAGARIFGLDESDALRVEAFAKETSAPAREGVRIEAIHPTPGEFGLSPSGEIDGAISGDLQRLAAALLRDLGQTGEAESSPPVDETVPRSSKVGVSVSALDGASLLSSGGVPYFGGLFGLKVEVTVGFGCLQGYGRDHCVAYSDHGNSCWIIGWETEDATDCRVRLHYGIAPFGSDTCRWGVYGDPM